MKWLSISLMMIMVACGPLTQGDPTLSIARGFTQGADKADDSGDQSLSDVLNRDYIEAQPNNLMLATVISREATALLVQAGNNGSKVTWFSPDGISITLDGGVLVATRGLGGDLMGSDASRLRAGFSGAGNYIRTQDYLNGLDQIETRTFQCSMSRDRAETITIYGASYATQVFVENCEGDGQVFRNTFWRASNGVIWQARQWISADAGYLGYQRL